MCYAWGHQPGSQLRVLKLVGDGDSNGLAARGGSLPSRVVRVCISPQISALRCEEVRLIVDQLNVNPHCPPPLGAVAKVLAASTSRRGLY